MADSPVSTIQWSTERPTFELVPDPLLTHIDYSPDKINDLYGNELSFGFASGSPDEVASFQAGIVSFVVGGNYFRDRRKDKIITQYCARQTFPLHRQTELRGLLATSQALSFEELEVLAGSLMKVIEMKASPENSNTNQ